MVERGNHTPVSRNGSAPRPRTPGKTIEDRKYQATHADGDRLPFVDLVTLAPNATSNGTTFSPHGTVGANVRTFTDTGLARKTYYWYRVRALNGTGASSFSSAVRIRTK